MGPPVSIESASGAHKVRSRAGNIQPSRRGATSTVEDYLKCILVHQISAAEATNTLELSDEENRVGMGTLSTALGVAPGTVTAMMKALGESGLVHYAPYAGVRLTESGQRLATHVLRRHRLIELFLVKVMQLDWGEVHAEAELLEHAVSDRLIERMDEMLGFPRADPHGDPIPTSDGPIVEVPLPSLMECAVDEELKVVRVLDQTADFLRALEADGVVPGSMIRVVERDDGSLSAQVTPAREETAAPGEPRTVRLDAQCAQKVVVGPGG